MADLIATGDIQQRVFMDSRNVPHLAHQVHILRRQGEGLPMGGRYQ